MNDEKETWNVITITSEDENTYVDSFLKLDRFYKPMWDEEHGGLVVVVDDKPFGYIPVIKYESKE